MGRWEVKRGVCHERIDWAEANDQKRKVDRIAAKGKMKRIRRRRSILKHKF